MKQLDNYILEKLYIGKGYNANMDQIDIICDILSSLFDDKYVVDDFKSWYKENNDYENPLLKMYTDFDPSKAASKEVPYIKKEYFDFININDKKRSKQLDDFLLLLNGDIEELDNVKLYRGWPIYTICINKKYNIYIEVSDNKNEEDR